MTNLAVPSGDDYPAAAKKHLNDAKALVDAKRFDGAGYLAGYAIECSLRSVVQAGEIVARAELKEKEMGSAFAFGSPTLKRFASVAAKEAYAKARDHDLKSLVTSSGGYSQVWTERNVAYSPAVDNCKLPFNGAPHKLRYRAEGVVSEKDAADWLQEATRVYTESVGLMLRDGVIRNGGARR